VIIMRISIWPGAGQPYGDVLEAARHASETGWHGVWIADHFMPNDGTGADPLHPVLEAGSLVAALGAAVPRVRIGTLVYGNTYRHPAVVANMAATVDHITRGRFTLGVGAGWQINEHDQYGIPLPPIGKRIDQFVEALQVIKGLLQTPRTTVDGTYYQLTDAVCEPKPVQDRLPIMIGAKGEQRMLRVVAEHADMWNTWGRPDLIAHKSAVLDRHCADVGRDPTSITRTAQALTVVDGEVPTGQTMPVIGGSRRDLEADLAAYRKVGVDELIIPDGLLGKGAAKFRAMDTLRSLIDD
jgi:alkanesulfonate monooxygenase SsuD/methylene tetrahydromethanopterin reductase-like flavin-dependent oxidoreductase (luciferase family)